MSVKYQSQRKIAKFRAMKPGFSYVKTAAIDTEIDGQIWIATFFT